MLLLATKGMRQWLVSLICNDPHKASGACHRSLQLIHLIKQAGWQLKAVAHQPQPPANRLVTLAKGCSAVVRHGALQPIGIASLRSQGHAAHWVAELHQRFPGMTGVVQEGTGYGSLSAVAEWRRHGVKTVLVPANIESLAPNIGSWTHQGLDVGQRFAHERRWWTMADAIFTISIEEAWWLQLHGIAAEWLPYYPAPEREQLLLAMRQQRQPDPAAGWLWLADFRNPANQAGVPLTLDWLQSCSELPPVIQIAGRGMAWLEKNYGQHLPEVVRLLGEATEAQLDQLYRSCTAQLIVHPATSGMLTRVVDAALAKIPIMGNSMALKSYASCFNDQSVVSFPYRSGQAEAAFINQLSS